MSGHNLEDPFRDPSIKNGEEISYCKEIEFAFKKEGSMEILTHPIIIKMITHTLNNRTLNTVRFEISAQSDIFFLYQVEYSEESFNVLKDMQRLKVRFDEFPEIMAEILDKASAGRKEFFVEFETTTNRKYLLNIVMPMRFKDVPIFSIEFHRAPEDLIHDQVQYRYNLVQYELRKTRIEVNNFIEALKLEQPKVKGLRTTGSKK